MNITELIEKVEKELSTDSTWTEGLFQYQEVKILDAVKLAIINATR